MKLNILANYLGTFWSIFGIYIFIPFYLRILGEEGYSLVMFSTTIQSIIFLLDAGFSAAIRRELSWGQKDTNFAEKSLSFIKTIEAFYAIILLVLLGIFFLVASWFSQHWFHFTHLSGQEVSTSIICMAGLAILQMQSNLYNGSFQALEHQVLSNIAQFFLILFRNGAVIVIILYFPYPSAFLLWQIVIMLIYLLIQRKLLFDKIKLFSSKVDKTKIQRSFTILKNSLSVSLLFLSISLLSTVNLQIDKIIISKFLQASNIGFYTTAYSLGQVLVAITGPVATALAPRLIKAYSMNEIDELKSTLHKYAKLNCILSSTLGLTLIFNSFSILQLWTQNDSFATRVNPMVLPMVIAGFCLSTQVLPYNIAVANLGLKPIIYTSIINIVITIPAYIWLTNSFGIWGTAMVWMLSNIIMMLVNVFLYLRKGVPNSFFDWLINDILFPLIVVSTIVIPLSYLKGHYEFKIIELLSIGTIFFLGLTGAGIFFFKPELKRFCLHYFGKLYE